MDMQAFDFVRQLAAGHYLTGTLGAVTELGIADSFADSETVAAVAARTGADADALDRMLRVLASRGIFAVADGRVRHTPASLLLREDHPASLRALVQMFGQEVQWRAAADLAACLRSGEAATPRLYPGGFWDYFRARPDEGRVFDAAMRAKAVAQIGGVLAHHDFGRYRRVTDIGGGEGHLLRALLAKHPGVEGLLFDQPEVIAAARAAGDATRLDFEAGDFFVSVPGGDAMILMEVLHDWADEEAHRILANVRRAAGPETRLLVIETEVPEGPEPHWSKLLDIVMLAQFASRQRTREGYRALLEANGFEVTSAVDTGADISIVEARPV